MVDASTTGPEPGQDTPQRLFRTLGFSFVHWFLWLVLWGCFLAPTGGLVLGWVLEGDITVKAKGAVRPHPVTSSRVPSTAASTKSV